MKVAGIVAEYNPFHNGHRYQIDQTRANGATHIIAVMSGNFVQRGDVAAFDKFQRAKAALKNGVDLVLCLPTAASVATAQKFASSAIELLNACGICDVISFGSESGDTDLIKTTAKALLNPELDGEIKTALSTGMSYATARQSALQKLYGNKIAQTIANPNDLLGIEYVRALYDLSSDIMPIAIKRIGAEHDSDKISDSIASASKLREMISNSLDISDFCPCNEFSNAASVNKGERAIISRLRRLSAADYGRLCDVSEGLHNRLYDAVQNGESLDEIYALCKTKRYAHSRIRRLVINAALGIYERPHNSCIRVLGFTLKGAELLKYIKQNGTLPVVTSYQDAKKYGGAVLSDFENESEYTDFYSLFQERITPCGEEMRQAVIKI